MTTRSKGPLAGFGWLQHGISASFRHPKPMFGGAGLLLLACLVPSLLTLPLQFSLRDAGAPPSPAVFIWVFAGSMLLGLLIVPLYAGYLQVVDAAERGQPARARDVFKPYRQGEALRLIGYGLALIVIYVALLGIVIVATGSGIVGWYMQALSAQANHQLPPGLPHGFGLTLLMMMLAGLFIMGFYSISLGQIALRRRGVFNAIGDGLMGALKNLLPLLVLAFSLLVAWIILAIALLIVIGVIVLIGKLAGVWLVLLLAIPIYIAMMLLVFAVMFGVMYYMWRDVCGDDTASGLVQRSLA
ncbi:MAG: hypothetical protein ACREPP_06565 [Rhodanobacteraceae bacterium]